MAAPSRPLTSTFVTSSDGAQIYAEAVGNPQNPALVLVAGYTLSSIVFEKQFKDPKLLSELYMIRYDMRGHGRSSMPETAEGHDSKLYADDFAAICKAFKVTKPVFAGWSLAGAIVTDICAHLGHDALSGAVQIAGLPCLGGDIVRNTINPDLLHHLPGLHSTDDVALSKRTFLAFGRTCFLDPDSVPFEVRMMWAGYSLLQPPVVTKLVFERKQDEQALFDAGRKGLRLLCLHGKQDIHRTSGMAVANELKPYFKNIEVVEINPAGHAVFYEKPEETNNALLAFTKKVTGN